jgi:benzoyl-CoA reductase/2-hydroxyglutaryl-CoA dehydratase subunit BcrC/BadD/HgdB
MYPESYAVVCSASQKGREMVHASQMGTFTQDLCSYSLIDFGAESYDGKLPLGGLPQPDMLIATNNQCGTTFLWFKLLAQKKNVPLFIIDYPAAIEDEGTTKEYIAGQYEELIDFVKKHTANTLNSEKLSETTAFSAKACDLWQKVHQLNRHNPIRIDANKIVDALFPIVVAKGTKAACDYYEALIAEHQQPKNASSADSVRLLWHGYPMWFLPKRFPGCFDEGYQIVLNDYTLWWNLDYKKGGDALDILITAYSNTYLNWPLDKKIEWVSGLVKEYSVKAVLCHANRSCRRTLADIVPLRKELSKIGIPAVIIESDMANPDFYSKEQVNLRIESFRDTLKV